MAPLALVVERVDVHLPVHRLVGDAEGLEDLVVEAVPAHQALRDVAEEESGLRPLDDAVVVGRGQGHRLADPELCDRTWVGRLEPGRIAERPDPDDEPLPWHEPGYGLHGAQGAGIGERHGGSREVLGRDAVGRDLAHQLLVGVDEASEVPGVGLGDAGDEQCPRALRLFDVDGEPEAHVAMAQDARSALAVDVGDECRVHGGHRGEPFDDRIADQVGEADLAAGGAKELVVDDGPVDLEQLRRHRPHARRRRDREGGLHVGDDPAGRAPQRRGFPVAVGRRRGAALQSRSRRRTEVSVRGGCDRRHLGQRG